MFDRLLQRFRESVRTGCYVLTVHAADEIEADGLNVYDVEHCVLSGRIVEKQRDRASKEWKYLVEGRTLSRAKAVVVAKIGSTGKLVIITVYLL